MQSRRLSLLIVLAVVCLSGPILACSVPVFRYALEHWSPDSYHLYLFHRGELSKELDGQLHEFSRSVNRSFANISLAAIDLEQDEIPSRLQRLVERVPADESAWCVLEGPSKGPFAGAVILDGAVSDVLKPDLIESPVRKEIIESLIQGTSAVWIHLDSGNAAIDVASYEILKREVARLQSELTLPIIDPADLKDLSATTEDVKLEFQTIQLSRENPDERALIEMLLSTEPDLRDEELQGQPMAFPVFGRGRVLYSLVGAGINPTTLEDACRFLTGACQCTVKAENPGVDLLLAKEWDQFFQPSFPGGVDVSLTGLAGFEADDATTEVTYVAVPPGLGSEGNKSASADADSDNVARTESDSRESAAEDAVVNKPTGDAPPSADAQPMVTGMWALLGLVALVTVVVSFGVISRR